MQALIVTFVVLALAATAYVQAEDQVDDSAQFHFYDEKYLNYTDAIKHCQELKGQLIEIDSEFRNKQVWNLMVQRGYSRAWIGITRHHIPNDRDTKTFYYQSLRYKRVTKAFWGAHYDRNEPNNFRNHKERCVEIRTLQKNSPTANWNDRPCDHLNPAICYLFKQ